MIRRRRRRLKDDGAPPFFAGEAGPAPDFERCSPAKNRDPHRRFAAAARSLTRPLRRRAQPFFKQDEEAKMTIDAHIEELRAEIKACLDRTEIATIERELAAALDERCKLETAAQVALQSNR